MDALKVATCPGILIALGMEGQLPAESTQVVNLSLLLHIQLVRPLQQVVAQAGQVVEVARAAVLHQVHLQDIIHVLRSQTPIFL